MATCEKCNGQGLIGAGDNPHFLEGRVITCDSCGGTGVKPEPVQQEAAPAPEPQVEQPVDNQPAEEAPKGGIFSRIFG